MTAADLAIVLAAIGTIAAFVVVLLTLQSLLRTVADLRGAVDRLEREAVPLVTELQRTVQRAGAEVDRVDDLLDAASAIQHTVDSASRLTYVAFSNPLIKIVALFRGLARGLRRASGTSGRRRRRVEVRRSQRARRTNDDVRPAVLDVDDVDDLAGAPTKRRRRPVRRSRSDQDRAPARSGRRAA